ncbi:MAG: hypothetical protein JSV16_14405 [Candidatus Hydrogenedentota bacterium]|nr:MAG: hypothetical protein JSV16_14405 [Candidatus Hydrogenedentota bacterium]
MPPRKKKEPEFRKCDCGQTWKTRDEFLHDRNVKIVGYQPDFVNHRYNHFLFHHRAKSCGQYLGVRASDFSDLREKECVDDLCIGQEQCPGYCTDTLDLRICSVTCRNASDRMIASKIRSRRILRTLRSAVAGAERRKQTGRKSARTR